MLLKYGYQKYILKVPKWNLKDDIVYLSYYLLRIVPVDSILLSEITVMKYIPAE